MKATRNWKMIGGWVLHGLIAGIMILAGSAKVLGFFPPEEVAKLGLSLPIQVIGAGELASAILLLIPRTSSLGLLLDRKSTRLNSSHSQISYAVFCLKKKKKNTYIHFNIKKKKINKNIK